MIRLRNHHPNLPFRGWVRTTTDEAPALLSGALPNGASYILGRRVGLDTRIVDIHCDLAPGQSLQLDLSQAEPWQPVPSFPPDLVAHFGGELFPSCDESPMDLVALQVDGAAILAQFRELRSDGALDLWVWWYPDEPAWCHGEALFTKSVPEDPSPTGAVPDIRLSWGDAIVDVLGVRPGSPILRGDIYAEGQARAVPVSFTWPRHFKTGLDVTSSVIAAHRQIGACGISKLLHDGNPRYAEAFRPSVMISKFGEAARRLHTWDPPLYGPSIRSSDTGDQEDQVFVRGEALLPGGEGAELVAWLSAIALHSRRPCNYLEADGSPLDPDKHTNPRLLFWNGQVHPSTSVSPDRLGKSRMPTLEETRGYYGPDIEHCLVNTLAASCRLTGSPVAQRLLRNLCVVYLLQRTEDPSWATTTEGIFLRGLGWEGIFVVHVWRDLEDRAMAQRVAERWRKRCRDVILPRLAAKDRDIWSTWGEVSASVPIAPGWIPWHQAIMAYGLDLACRVLGPTEGCAVALRGAKRVVEDVWQREGDRWVEYERLSMAGDRSRSGYFAAAWFPPVLSVVLRYEPEHPKARSVWEQITADRAGSLDQSWLPPMETLQ